jgi:hypothetical protein
MDKADDLDNERPFAHSTQASFSGPVPEDVDWFGNTSLHHCFASNDIVMAEVKGKLSENPDLAKIKNQFGRIPLHYALDRIKVGYYCRVGCEVMGVYR